MTDEISKVDNPWREFIENCIDGSNYFRSSEYYQLLADLDRLYCLEAATTPAEVDDGHSAFYNLRELTECRCHEDYKSRGRIGPDCNHLYREDVDTLARQLAEKTKLADDVYEMLSAQLTEAFAEKVDQRIRAEQAESQLAEATRRLGEVEKAARQWKQDAREMGRDSDPRGIWNETLVNCADRIHAALTKEQAK